MPQVPALPVLKPFGLATAPGHAARIQAASRAPKEWDLLPVCRAVEQHLLTQSVRSFQEIPSRNRAALVMLYPHARSTGIFSSG